MCRYLTVDASVIMSRHQQPARSSELKLVPVPMPQLLTKTRKVFCKLELKVHP